MPTGQTSLITILGITKAERIVSVIGAGGKSTLIRLLASELALLNRRVLVTTTTKIFPNQMGPKANLQLLGNPYTGEMEIVVEPSQILTVGREIKDGKLLGVDPRVVHELSKCVDHVLVEADGAKGKSIKAPESWEPVIPDDTNLTIVVIGLDCLGQPADEKTVFRLERYLEVTKQKKNELVTVDAFKALFNNPKGILHGIPIHSRVLILFNKMDAVIGKISKREALGIASVSTKHEVFFGSMQPVVKVWRCTDLV